MEITITALSEEDRDEWEPLYYGYAEFYQTVMTDEILSTVWKWIFDEKEAFYCLIAKDDQGRGIGLMHFREMNSPLRGKKVGFLDDLFVTSDCRGKGVVDKMFAELSRISKDNNWPFVRWITAEDNYRGRGAYDKVAEKTKWLTYQMNV